MDYNDMFSKRVVDLKASTIREIFKLIGQKDIISLAGGAPAVESFPAKELGEIAKELLVNKPHISLQYGTTEGHTPLRNILKERMSKINNINEDDELIIVTGGQQGIDLALRVLIDEGQGVIVEEPSFIGTLNSARSYNAKLFAAPVLDDGMDLEVVEKYLQTEDIKLIYTIPTFQNPSGITMSREKRLKLLDLAEKYNVLILEDNPYGELRFKGEPVENIKSLDKFGRVIYIGSFSKILSSGLRVGFAIANKEIIEKMVVVKQVNDVHTAILNQMMVEEYMTRYDIDVHIEGIRELYRSRCDAMLSAMDATFPDYCKYTRPEGGIFIYVTLPKGVNTIELLKCAVENKVAFVPGHTFNVDIDTPANTFRLNYSSMNEDKIKEGIEILAKVIKDFVG